MLEKPSARISGTSLSEFGLREATVEFDVRISNPYGVSLPLADMEYNLSSNDRSFLGGRLKVEESVPARGQKTIQVPARVTYRKLIDVVRGIRPGEVIPYTAELTLSVDSPGGNTIELPMAKQGKLPVPVVPDVRLRSVKWREIGLTQTTAVLNLGVRNRHVFSVTMENIKYALDLGGSKVIESSMTRSHRFEAGGSQSIQIPVSLSITKLGQGLLSIFRQDRASYELRGELGVSTPYGSLTMPYNSSGQTPFVGN